VFVLYFFQRFINLEQTLRERASKMFLSLKELSKISGIAYQTILMYSKKRGDEIKGHIKGYLELLEVLTPEQRENFVHQKLGTKDV
jgi:hypothetical protein